jgi:hypothetical protein
MEGRGGYTEEEISSVEIPSARTQRREPQAKAASFLDSLFRKEPLNGDITLSREDQRQLAESMTYLEAGLGNAGRECIVSFQRWGDGFWNLPDKELFEGLIKSFFNQALIVVGARKKQMLALKNDVKLPESKKGNFVQFPPLTQSMIDNFEASKEDPSQANDFIDTNCTTNKEMCYRTLKIDRGHFKSISQSILNAHENNDALKNDWTSMITSVVAGDVGGKSRGGTSSFKKLPEVLRSMFRNFLIDPRDETWSNFITGMVLFKFYTDFRGNDAVRGLWEENNVSKLVINGELTRFLGILNDYKKYSIPQYYENNQGRYPEEYTKLITNFANPNNAALWFNDLTASYAQLQEEGNNNPSPRQVWQKSESQESEGAEPLPVVPTAKAKEINRQAAINNPAAALAGGELDKAVTTKRKKKKDVSEEPPAAAGPTGVTTFRFGPKLEISARQFQNLASLFEKNAKTLNSNDDIASGKSVKDIQESIKKDKDLSDFVDVLCDLKNARSENGILRARDTFVDRLYGVPKQASSNQVFVSNVNDNNAPPPPIMKTVTRKFGREDIGDVEEQVLSGQSQPKKMVPTRRSVRTITPTSETRFSDFNTEG